MKQLYTKLLTCIVLLGGQNKDSRGKELRQFKWDRVTQWQNSNSQALPKLPPQILATLWTYCGKAAKQRQRQRRKPNTIQRNKLRQFNPSQLRGPIMLKFTTKLLLSVRYSHSLPLAIRSSLADSIKERYRGYKKLGRKWVLVR